MRRWAIALLAGHALLQCSAGSAADAPAQTATAAPAAPEARIAFADHDGIYDWRVVDRSTLLIQGRDRKWYQARLFAPCFDLPFAQAIGFKSNPDGSFDKFSALKVGAQECRLSSLVETTAPPKPGKRKVTDPKRSDGDKVS